MHKLNSNVYYKVVNEHKIFLMDVLSDDSTMLEIHGVSAEVFTLMIEGRDLSYIKSILSKKYSVSEDILDTDITSFLKDLDTHKVFNKE